MITENSVWKFDVDLKRYIRFPRGETPPEHYAIPYDGDWDDYDELIPLGNRLLVLRPVPYGQGRERLTGPIEYDSGDPT